MNQRDHRTEICQGEGDPDGAYCRAALTAGISIAIGERPTNGLRQVRQASPKSCEIP